MRKRRRVGGLETRLAWGAPARLPADPPTRLGLPLCDLRDPPERVGVSHREIREDLPVDVDPGLLEAGHQAAVAQPMHAGRGVDPGDPERAELALLLAAVPVRIAHGALDRFLGRLVKLAPTA